MVLKLISATPSPYARKVRIALLEKHIPFDLQTEVPWNSTTETPKYNPLEKLPVLIPDSGPAVYESHFIMEWIEMNYPAPHYTRLLPEEKGKELEAKKIEVLADGICDAGILLFFEEQREYPSEEWSARQRRKIEGGLRALDDIVGRKEGEFVIGNEFGLADIAVGSALGWFKVRFAALGWETRLPNLARYAEELEQRESFKSTRPSPQSIRDKIV